MRNLARKIIETICLNPVVYFLLCGLLLLSCSCVNNITNLKEEIIMDSVSNNEELKRVVRWWNSVVSNKVSIESLSDIDSLDYSERLDIQNNTDIEVIEKYGSPDSVDSDTLSYGFSYGPAPFPIFFKMHKERFAIVKRYAWWNIDSIGNDRFVWFVYRNDGFYYTLFSTEFDFSKVME